MQASLSPQIDLAGLALRLGRDKTNVCRKAKELGLTQQSRKKVATLKSAPKFSTSEERRAFQSALQASRIAEHGHPRGSLGLKHSAETIQKISLKSKLRWASMSQEQRDDLVLKRVKAKRDAGVPFANPRGSWKAAWREIGGKRCFFRSRWEANYARYLEWLKSIGQIAEWEHEAKTFWFEGIKRGCVSYLPDFKVTECNGKVQWHEVKGWMDARSKTTIARMGRYHPQEVLVVVREKQYRDIERKVSTLIVGWES
jgi:hypothetical protein